MANPDAKPRKEVPVLVGGPHTRKGSLKDIGGSRSDHWNNTLANQAISTLWTAHSDEATRSRHRGNGRCLSISV